MKIAQYEGQISVVCTKIGNQHRTRELYNNCKNRNQNVSKSIKIKAPRSLKETAEHSKELVIPT